jgi:hypothetical protein
LIDKNGVELDVIVTNTLAEQEMSTELQEKELFEKLAFTAPENWIAPPRNPEN